ncbi:MAG: hypothetical protein COV74_08060 [Candidatus Omnitrophica bacterium CG11_big_fil_rev_8_21_14_0_20_45_26]|uniref:Uncharacterized protein n=1 Tax=Candidatus Abzuiibacterium crystallinum TaxID=1974748 RepID=A0A2H0LMI0_9BACT|nr:MAG: hypothetical protein COV74_08060 [Candidatus Omnitrophica bacterium CG11_big_fil_rev_8_21_14_0_20_45_26]PIW65173.1 MAG: hypothetical protein COW12_03100 [Candidatus Omnitrophica bacterium CG12_big_fil_rev_8_21_14_0_65_45_16]
MIQLLAYWALKILARLAQLLPNACYPFTATLLGKLAYCLDKRRYVAYANLKAAFQTRYSPKELKGIIQRQYEHLCYCFLEILNFPKMDQAYINQFVTMENGHWYEEAVQKKRRAMLMTAHFDNWEMLQTYSGIRGYPLYVLVRDQRHTKLNDFLNQLRESHGATPISTTGMGLRDLVRTLKQGNPVGVLGDQGGGRDGSYVRFFGRKTTAPKGLMSMALRCEADVIPCFSVREKGLYHRIIMKAPLLLSQTGDELKDDLINNQLFLDQLEPMIQAYPEQWLWIHKRWKFCFTKRVVVLEDERAGHAAQARAVGQQFHELHRELPHYDEFQIDRVPVRYKSKRHRFLFTYLSWIMHPFAQSRLSWLNFFFTHETTNQLNQIPHADFVVTCGAGLTPLAWWLKSEFLSKIIMVMKPAFPFSRFRYDVMVVPKHDQTTHLRGKTIPTSAALCWIDKKQMESEGERLSGQLKLNGARRISIFIGGETKKYRLNDHRVDQWLAAANQLSQKEKFDLLVTTSRRTSVLTAETVKRTLSANQRCRLLVIANEKNIENVTLGMLALSDIVVVTEDSVSMISEALAAGKRVLVMKVGNGQLSEKHQLFQQTLKNDGLIETATEVDFEEKIGQLMAKHAVMFPIENELSQLRSILREEL